MKDSIFKQLRFTYKDYQDQYSSRLLEFLAEFEDNTEAYFIDREFKILDKSIKDFKQIILDLTDEDENQTEYLDLFENRINTNARISEFLNGRKKNIELNPESKFENENQQLEWQGTSLQFSELVKALFEAGVFEKLYQAKKITEIELYKSLGTLILVKDFLPHAKFEQRKSSNNSDISNRVNDKTPFIEILRNKLEEWIKKTIDKRDKNKD